jgi:hypothetical protein
MVRWHEDVGRSGGRRQADISQFDFVVAMQCADFGAGNQSRFSLGLAARQGSVTPFNQSTFGDLQGIVAIPDLSAHERSLTTTVSTG